MIRKTTRDKSQNDRSIKILFRAEWSFFAIHIPPCLPPHLPNSVFFIIQICMNLLLSSRDSNYFCDGSACLKMKNKGMISYLWKIALLLCKEKKNYRIPHKYYKTNDVIKTRESWYKNQLLFQNLNKFKRWVAGIKKNIIQIKTYS